MSSGAIPAAELEPTVFVVAALGEVVAELRDEPPTHLSQALAYQAAARVLDAVLAPRA